jgi:hypothetical protein
LFILSITGVSVSFAERTVIGETAWIEVGSVPFTYLARIDTGARTTSIHAIDVKVMDGSVDPDENVGKDVSFRTLSRDGKSTLLTRPIVKVSTVTNSQGTEQRYVVSLQVANGDVEKDVEVNLRDRTAMSYKLLIGRNWLTKDFLVDVDLKADENGGTK